MKLVVNDRVLLTPGVLRMLGKMMYSKIRVDLLCLARLKIPLPKFFRNLGWIA